jgi:hypothetical protein
MMQLGDWADFLRIFADLLGFRKDLLCLVVPNGAETWTDRVSGI